MVEEKSGAIQADGGHGAWAVRNIDNVIEIDRPGYLLVFTSPLARRSVFWDQLVLTKGQGRVWEENHYYPFGLTLSESSVNPTERNDYKLTTKELESSFGLQHTAFFRCPPGCPIAPGTAFARTLSEL